MSPARTYASLDLLDGLSRSYVKHPERILLGDA